MWTQHILKKDSTTPKQRLWKKLCQVSIKLLNRSRLPTFWQREFLDTCFPFKFVLLSIDVSVSDLVLIISFNPPRPPVFFISPRYGDNEEYLLSDYRFANGYLYCATAQVALTYAYLPDLETSAAGLPPFITRLLTLHMAQNMVIELSGSENRHEILFKQYTLALRRARMLQGRQGPAQTYINDNNSSFIGAHQNYGKV